MQPRSKKAYLLITRLGWLELLHPCLIDSAARLIGSHEADRRRDSSCFVGSGTEYPPSEAPVNMAFCKLARAFKCP